VTLGGSFFEAGGEFLVNSGRAVRSLLSVHFHGLCARFCCPDYVAPQHDKGLPEKRVLASLAH